jgi:tetratricopeptide (TPR) repeat protein
VQINPNSAAAYNSLGHLMIMQGQTADAIATYQESVRRIPKNPEAYYSLGTTWYNQGDFKKANIAFQRAQKQYREQGNYQQADKLEQVLQQIAQGNKNPGETLPTSQTPAETPQPPIQSNNPAEVNPNNMIEFGQPMPGKS